MIVFKYIYIYHLILLIISINPLDLTYPHSHIFPTDVDNNYLTDKVVYGSFDPSANIYTIANESSNTYLSFYSP